MSNALAVAAVTATLRARVFAALGGAAVTTAAPDKAPTAVGSEHVNLFLYRTDLHPSFRNEPPPGTRDGETARPLLPLVLHYLLASYSDDESRAQQLLGSAMLALHDGAILPREEIRQATIAAGGSLAGSDLHLQAAEVTVTHESLSQDDIAKMWTAFQAPYRMSVSYQVSVVLIDSALPGRAPLPVLTRGPGDRAAEARPSAAFPYPAVVTIDYPIADLPSVLAGEEVTCTVANLSAGPLEGRLRHRRLGTSLVAAAVPGTAGHGGQRVAVTVPATAPAGPWALALAVPGADGPLTPEVEVAVRPEVTALQAADAGAGRRRVTATLATPVQVGQVCSVVVGGLGLAVPLLQAAGADLSASAVLPPGVAKVRVRVDGVESDLVDRATGTFRTGPTAEVVIP
ncbi:MAG TPA: DUF4255 domain-containing protein [Kineosporiaceae bacterium]